jgi:pyridoxamine 5'-phosphate oxidase family protein
MFSEQEIAYVKAQRLARMATVSRSLQPDVVPVGFDFDGVRFYVGGYDLTHTRKYKNVQNNPRVALVIDDLVSVKPWKARGIRVYGKADLITHDGYAGSGTYIRITPTAKWSWGMNGKA